MISIFKNIQSIAGHDYKSHGYEHPENGNIYFKQDFASFGYIPLSFNNYSELLEYLDGKFPNEDKMVIVNGELWYPLSCGDRDLVYFATIED